MELLDGRALAQTLNRALKHRVDGMSRPPGLAVVLVGDDPASQIYVRLKARVAVRIGFAHQQINLPEDIRQGRLLDVIDGLNADPNVDGILIQMPLPDHVDTSEIIDRIAAEKDVDGLTAASAGALARGKPRLTSCTPKGVMRLLVASGVELEGAHAVVVGRSNIVGRPMASLLEQANCTVTLCHSRTRDLRAMVQSADILVVAVGRAELVRGDWIRKGAVVIDVGVNRLEDGGLVGDVAFDEARSRVAAITPVPGGVGPMTIAMLMENTVEAALARGVVMVPTTDPDSR